MPSPSLSPFPGLAPSSPATAYAHRILDTWDCSLCRNTSLDTPNDPRLPVDSARAPLSWSSLNWACVRCLPKQPIHSLPLSQHSSRFRCIGPGPTYPKPTLRTTAYRCLLVIDRAITSSSPRVCALKHFEPNSVFRYEPDPPPQPGCTNHKHFGTLFRFLSDHRTLLPPYSPTFDHYRFWSPFPWSNIYICKLDTI